MSAAPRPPSDWPSSSGEPPTAPPGLEPTAEPELPSHLGRYQVTAKLGQGGFGVVYKAYDDQLRRDVAIKVPHPERLRSPEDAEAYLAEAQIVARLDHPHIVTVHDVGPTSDGRCYVVSKFIDGSDLAQQIKTARLSYLQAVELVATVAEALHHAHISGLVHRDVKPGNILIDHAGKVYIADFGLAMKEEDYGHGGGGILGTPAYMSPEQANGEGHRVDGRSDIFSLGVVFYELLTGRRPFKGATAVLLLQAIVRDEPRPPRQVEDTIPKELERICLKALAKRASERYTTAKDLADDLRQFLQQSTEEEKSVLRSAVGARSGDRAPTGGDRAPAGAALTPTAEPVKIVPKGLRAFDAHDADFFLELLPGPRDRDGWPESIRFWKRRIEETDADKTFAVGLIYGPSGCGKSSLVQAGLLPRLASSVLPVYVEATAQETEARLLNGLRKRCPGLDPHLGLKDSLAALRHGQGLAAGQKVLLVLDQFEQWLHAHGAGSVSDGTSQELVHALRQCDGARVQCLVLVRDDFWLAVSRFLKELEVRLLEGHNSALVDLFDPDHARKVLAGFGRAFGKLPERAGLASKDQQPFVEQAVAGLAQERKVVCVRLALFAEMMKGKPWTAASLKAVGGTEGVGVTFLEETFSAATAPPEHRYHQRAARAVLQALLPEADTDIKGTMRSQQDLLAASGYAGQPRDFEDLLRILDSELRMITPIDPEGVLNGEPGALATGELAPVANAPGSPAPRYYQLTHDYLVPALRDWLTRKQKESRRGRAELLLADRAAVWKARPENRQLPSFLQWLQIRRWTHKKNWTPPQRQMMRRAARYHLIRTGLAAALVLLLAVLGRDGWGRVQAHHLRDRLVDANTAEVHAIVQDMAPYRRWINPLLREEYARAYTTNDRRMGLHTSLALAPVDPGQKAYLSNRLLLAQAQEVIPIRKGLEPYRTQLTEQLWNILADRGKIMDNRFRVACALADYTPQDPRWENVREDVAAHLVIQNPSTLGAWADALRPVGPTLLGPLAAFLEDDRRNGSARAVIADLYQKLAADRPEAFARLDQVLARPSKDVAAIKRQANVGVALVAMGHGDKVWPLLKHSPDPTLRSFLIDRLAPGGADPQVLLSRLEREPEVSIRRALLLSLGEFGLDRLPPGERQNHIPWLLQIYRQDPDPGIHGAAGWLLRQWQAEAQLRQIDKELATGKVEGKRRWYINRQGQTLVLVPQPAGEVTVGEGNEQRKERIGWSYFIGAKEVTVADYVKFRKDQRQFKRYARTDDCPMMEVSWHDAAAYCNELSKQEGIDKDQWCYEPAGKEGEMKPAANHLQRTAYRLATEAEWEYACLAGAVTAFCYGEPDELLAKYGWFVGNSLTRSHPVGALKPNDLGLFDMHGNAVEWCYDWYDKGASHRVLRGGSWGFDSGICRAAYRFRGGLSYRTYFLGFRLARVAVGVQGK
jgi:formylglycine-generating enzyme required for sulfatase activity